MCLRTFFNGHRVKFSHKGNFIISSSNHHTKYLKTKPNGIRNLKALQLIETK